LQIPEEKIQKKSKAVRKKVAKKMVALLHA